MTISPSMTIASAMTIKTVFSVSSISSMMTSVGVANLSGNFLRHLSGHLDWDLGAVFLGDIHTVLPRNLNQSEVSIGKVDQSELSNLILINKNTLDLFKQTSMTSDSSVSAPDL